MYSSAPFPLMLPNELFEAYSGHKAILFIKLIIIYALSVTLLDKIPIQGERREMILREVVSYDRFSIPVGF